jgi:outer membrane murein-binding lipoprotein Lpp
MPLICVHLRSSAALLVCACLLCGCGSPSKANITLRKQMQSMEDQIAELKRQHEADRAQIRGLQQDRPSVASLPQERLDQLFTVHGLSLGRVTGGADLDPSKPGDEGIKVQVVPTDDAGDPIKAAGSLVIDAFDLSNTRGDTHVGHWEFDVTQARQNWNGFRFIYSYVLTLPWQQAPPAHPELTVKVTFTDALTGRTFDVQRVVRVDLPPKQQESTTAPSASVARP